MSAIVEYPVIVMNDQQELWLLQPDRDPTYTFEVIDIDNNEYLLWDARGRGVVLRHDAQARRVSLAYDERGDDGIALERRLTTYGTAIGWSEDCQALVTCHAPYPVIVRYLVWASMHKRGPGSTVK